jgi:preprotein translocase subunit SecA
MKFNPFKRLFPSRNERLLKKHQVQVEKILSREAEFQAMSDQRLRDLFEENRRRYRKEENSLDDLLPEIFAITREVCDRRLGIWNVFNPEFSYNWQQAPKVVQEAMEVCQKARDEGKSPCETFLEAEFYEAIRQQYSQSRPPFRMQSFPVQLIGGMVLHEGKIAEMRTGEGKTLASVNAVVLNALEGQVFVVTVNDYLAVRDAGMMAPAYLFLGLSCSALQSQMPLNYRREMYESDIVYGTNSEFGFDYLRDNMATSLEEQVQKRRFFAIIDEVDSVLIDEARTPLIISGRPESGRTPYDKANEVAGFLKNPEHFEVEEKHKSATLTEAGVAQCEKLLGIENMYSGRNLEWPHLIENAVRARELYLLDRDYVISEDPEGGGREIVIVDEFTGRLQPGRRWGDGLHQAIEAKEGLDTREESVTLATVTIQNYFRMFDRLAGMTGTAFTEAQEFYEIYQLDVVVLPTHRPMIRKDHVDLIYGSYEAKCRAIIKSIVELNEKGRPVLVGTTSVAKSEDLSARLKKKGIPHQVLNAKNHAQEAEIIKLAGQRATVTIATNMAGRGTDIVLGEGVVDLGGLHIIGTERHESRRIDNQLRGRAGRQGDPGSSRFYLSLEDDLIRVFANDRMRQFMQKSLPEDEMIENRLVSRSIERAQKRVEEHHFGVRKSLIEYDDVKNEQRKLIYEERQAILERENIRAQALNMVEDDVRLEAEKTLGPQLKAHERSPEEFLHYCHNHLGIDLKIEASELQSEEQAVDESMALFKKRYDAIENSMDKEVFETELSYLLLYKIDNKWKDHLQEMDRLRSSIGLMGYAQMDPKIAYKKEGFELFDQMLKNWAHDVASLILKIEAPLQEDELEADFGDFFGVASMDAVHEDFVEHKQLEQKSRQRQTVTAPVQRKEAKISRNAPCPCGSGKKYKQCHGAQG